MLVGEDDGITLGWSDGRLEFSGTSAWPKVVGDPVDAEEGLGAWEEEEGTAVVECGAVG